MLQVVTSHRKDEIKGINLSTFSHDSLEKIKKYIPNSIKVALGFGQLRIGKLLFGGHSSKAFHCVPCAQMPNAQLPKQPFLN